jgi:hypothetical protein
LRWQLQAAARLAEEQQQLLQHMQAPQALKVELKVGPGAAGHLLVAWLLYSV